MARAFRRHHERVSAAPRPLSQTLLLLPPAVLLSLVHSDAGRLARATPLREAAAEASEAPLRSEIQAIEPREVLSERAPDGPSSASSASICPPEMVLVEGSYCPNPQHRCLRWLDDESLPFARCDVYEEPVRCFGERVPMRFCIGRYEYSEPGESLPTNDLSYVAAARLCKARGQRLCTEDEWNFACEGEEMRPHPYGFRREPVCNQDRGDLVEMRDGSQVLRDQRAAHAAFPDCKSPFGVFNMVGNVDEPVLRPGPHQPSFHMSLKGGWWMAARNRCRPATRSHDDYYRGVQVGARCCRDARDP